MAGNIDHIFIGLEIITLYSNGKDSGVSVKIKKGPVTYSLEKHVLYKSQI